MSPAEIIKWIKEYHRRTGKTPGRRDFEGSLPQLKKHFRSWNNAVIEAGLPVRRSTVTTTEELIRSLKSFYDKYGHSPRAADCRRSKGLYDTKTYITRLGKTTWPEVLELAGLPPYFHKHRYTEDEAIIKIVKLIRATGIRTIEEYRAIKGDLPSAAYVNERWLWKDILIAAGIKEEVTKKSITDAVKLFINEENYVPSTPEIASMLKTSVRAITGITGPFNKFLKNMGYEPSYVTPTPNNLSKPELLELYKQISESAGFENGATIKYLDQSPDTPKADVFVSKFGSLTELRRSAGYPLRNIRHLKYSREMVKKQLKLEYFRHGRRLKNKEINKNKKLPALSTVLRLFNQTSMSAVWAEILKK